MLKKDLLIDNRSSITIQKDKKLFTDHTQNQMLSQQDYLSDELFLDYLENNEEINTWEILDKTSPNAQKYYLHWTSGGMERYETQSELNRILSQECDGKWKVEYQDHRLNQEHYVLDESTWWQTQYREFSSAADFNEMYTINHQSNYFSSQVWDFGVKVLTFAGLASLYHFHQEQTVDNVVMNSLFLFPLASAEPLLNNHVQLDDDYFLIDPDTLGFQCYPDITLLPQGYLVAHSTDDGSMKEVKLFNTFFDEDHHVLNKTFQIEKGKNIFQSTSAGPFLKNKYYIQAFTTNLPFNSFLQVNEVATGNQYGELLQVDPSPSPSSTLVYSLAPANDDEVHVVWTVWPIFNSSPNVFHAKAKFINDTLQMGPKQQINPPSLYASLARIAVAKNTGDYKLAYVSTIRGSSNPSQNRAISYYKNDTQTSPDSLVYPMPGGIQTYPSIATSPTGTTLITFSQGATFNEPVPWSTFAQFLDAKGNHIGNTFNFQVMNPYAKYLSDWTMHVVDDVFLTFWFGYADNQHIGGYYGRYTKASQTGLIGEEFALAPKSTFSQVYWKYDYKRVVAALNKDGCYYTVIYSTEDLSKGPNSILRGKKFSSRLCVFNIDSLSGYKGQTILLKNLKVDAPIHAYPTNNMTLSFAVQPASIGNFFITDTPLPIKGNNTEKLEVSGSLASLNEMFASLKLSLNKSQNQNGTWIITGNDHIMPAFTANAELNMFSIPPIIIQEEPMRILDGSYDNFLVTPEQIKATVAGNEEPSLHFHVIPPTEFCNFYLTNDKNYNPIMSFTQQNIIDGKISFKYSPATQAGPRYSIWACNGDSPTNMDCSEPKKGWISIYYKNPLILDKNTITITQGKKVILDENNFNATNKEDNENYLNIRYELKNVQYCLFQFLNGTPAEGLTHFYQHEINQKLIQFVDQGYTIPSFMVRVLDSPYETDWFSPGISYIKSDNSEPEDDSLYGQFLKYWPHGLSLLSIFTVGTTCYSLYQEKKKKNGMEANLFLFNLDVKLKKKKVTLNTNYTDKRAEHLNTFFIDFKSQINKILIDQNIPTYNDEELQDNISVFLTAIENIERFFRKTSCSFYSTKELNFDLLKDEQNDMMLKLIRDKLDKVDDREVILEKIAITLDQNNVSMRGYQRITLRNSIQVRK